MTNPSNSQSKIIEFLTNYNNVNNSPNQKIETHCAMVFLIGEKAYKVKKNVSFPFLDFSTLTLRKNAFIKEFELNKRTASDIYLRLLKLVESSDGEYELQESDINSKDQLQTPEDDVVEWVLEMRQFPQDNLLSNLAANNSLGQDIIKALAREIVTFHESAKAFTAFDEVDFCTNLDHVIAENNDDLKNAHEILGKDRIDNIIFNSCKNFEKNKGLIKTRQELGYVKHCHGDLHLQNIVIYKDKPTLFDCLEFNDDYARIDVLYDIAFLIMDLVARDLIHYANLTLNQYINHDKNFDDYSVLNLLPLFLATRSAIRSKISFSISGQVEDEKTKEFFISETEKYFLLMEEFLTPHKPKLYAIAGLSGSGKSSVAAKLAYNIKPNPGAIILRSDVMRKKLMGADIDEKLSNDAYKPEINLRVYDALLSSAKQCLNAGFSVIIDAVMAKEEERKSFEDLANAESVDFAGIWLDTDKATLLKRVDKRKSKTSDADAKVVEMQADYELGDMSFSKINSSQPLGDIIGQILKF